MVPPSPPPAAPPSAIVLHPENPRYFLFRGKPTVLVGSTEHYGAVLNLDFDYVRYLDELRRRHLNLTRLFSGTYREVPGSFGIQGNTLAPPPGRYAAPWARSAEPGASDGGPKFDLARWDEAYLRRLKDFCTQAGKRGVVVEFVLFCPFYEDALWRADPMNAANNVNGVGRMPREEVYTLAHPEMLAVHEAVTRKLVTELNPFDNVYFEVCNEPYFGGVTLDWQRRIAAVIAETEAGLPRKHLVAQNIANGSARVTDPIAGVSILNFHYASPPDSVAANWEMRLPVAFDETGFKGTHDAVYRTEGWEFLMAGGSVYDNLDYSFTAAHPDGTAPVTEPTPGGGGPALRDQLAILKGFVESLPFLRMAPDRTVVAGGVPQGGAAWALAEPGRAYAVYLRGGTQATLTLALAPGRYRAEWVDTKTGAVALREDLDHKDGSAALASPAYTEDIALRILRR